MRTLARFTIAGVVGAVALIALAIPPAEASAHGVAFAVSRAVAAHPVGVRTLGQLTAAAKPNCFFRA
jgi:hypothetical protein